MCGGKHAEACAADCVEQLTRHEHLYPAESNQIRQPSPTRPLSGGWHFIFSGDREAPAPDDLDSDDGFWPIRGECLEHDFVEVAFLQERAASRAQEIPTEPFEFEEEDLEGGALPAETVAGLPGYFFDLQYLQALACVSKSCYDAVRCKEHWRGRCLILQGLGFEKRSMVNSDKLAGILAVAHTVSLEIRHVPLFNRIPQNACLAWSLLPPSLLPLRNNVTTSCLSKGPLLGFAMFDLQLPVTAVGLYIGVRQWQGGDRRIYCRVDNLFRPDLTWSFSVNTEPWRPHPGRERCRIQRDNRFVVSWTEQSFAVRLNGEEVSSLRITDPSLRGPSPLAQAHITVVERFHEAVDQPTVVPLRSGIQQNTHIRCPLCLNSRTLCSARWAICRCCCTWVCRTHIRDEPRRGCPRCGQALGDFVGGSSIGVKKLPVTLRFAAGCCEIQTRLRRSDKELNDVTGGSAELIPDVMGLIPGYLDRYDEIHVLATCCSALLRSVLDRTYWRGRHIRLDVDCLANNATAISCAAVLFEEAASVTMHVAQLACVRRRFPRALVNWLPRELQLPGDNVRGWVSSHSLMGGARFLLSLPRATQSLYIGSKGEGGERRSYCVITNPHCSQCKLFLGLSGTQRVEWSSSQLRRAFAPAGSCNEFLFGWTSRSLLLRVNGHDIALAELRPEAPDAPPAFSSLFIWVISRPLTTEQISFSPLASPVVWNSHIRPGQPRVL